MKEALWPDYMWIIAYIMKKLLKDVRESIIQYIGPVLKMRGERADKFGNNTKNVGGTMALFFIVTTVWDLLVSVNLSFNG
jgi:hypothetical protein